MLTGSTRDHEEYKGLQHSVKSCKEARSMVGKEFGADILCKKYNRCASFLAWFTDKIYDTLREEHKTKGNAQEELELKFSICKVIFICFVVHKIMWELRRAGGAKFAYPIHSILSNNLEESEKYDKTYPPLTYDEIETIINYNARNFLSSLQHEIEKIFPGFRHTPAMYLNCNRSPMIIMFTGGFVDNGDYGNAQRRWHVLDVAGGTNSANKIIGISKYALIERIIYLHDECLREDNSDEGFRSSNKIYIYIHHIESIYNKIVAHYGECQEIKILIEKIIYTMFTKYIDYSDTHQYSDFFYRNQRLRVLSFELVEALNKNFFISWKILVPIIKKMIFRTIFEMKNVISSTVAIESFLNKVGIDRNTIPGEHILLMKHENGTFRQNLNKIRNESVVTQKKINLLQDCVKFTLARSQIPDVFQEYHDMMQFTKDEMDTLIIDTRDRDIPYSANRNCIFALHSVILRHLLIESKRSQNPEPSAAQRIVDRKNCKFVLYAGMKWKKLTVIDLMYNRNEFPKSLAYHSLIVYTLIKKLKLPYPVCMSILSAIHFNSIIMD